MNSPLINTKTKWVVDQASSEIAFKVKHLMISHVKGIFADFGGNIYTKAADFTTVVIDFWIDASSLTTGDAKRDEHLKGADFFDASRHRQIVFLSGSIASIDTEGNYHLHGQLTIKEITKPVKLSMMFNGIVKDLYGTETASFIVKGKVERSHWGLAWNALMDNGGFLVREGVDIECRVKLVNSDQRNLVMELQNRI